MHITIGYWGSATYIGTGFSDRLAGGLYDDVNPNGLAFIIVFTLPLIHFVTKKSSLFLRLLYYLLIPLFIYALILTQSRSGLIGLFVVTAGILMTIRRKFLVALLIIVCALAVWGSLDEIHKQRYLSIDIFNKNVVGHETAQGRIEGWKWGFKVFLNRPLFGHGLGTSAEAGWNVVGHGQIAHNMYIEVLQELGIIGFAIFLLFIKRMFESLLMLKQRMAFDAHGTQFLIDLVTALEIQGVLLIIFSMASYGLSTYIWYLIVGLTTIVHTIAGEVDVCS